MRKTFSAQLLENFINLNKEANKNFRKVERSMNNSHKSFEIVSKNKRRHFSQNKSPKVWLKVCHLLIIRN